MKSEIERLIERIDFYEREMKLKERFKLIIGILGLLDFIAWLTLFILISRALFNDQSYILGFDEKYGIIVVAFNYFGEMLIEFIIILFILSFSTYLTIKYLVRK
ncbi:MAG: hypothetical protein ACTSRP_15760 [Candidatus Helarchaeota archaeon]